MPLRNGEHGYGTVTKVLHWATVALLAVQLTVGYAMDVDGSGRGRGQGRGGASGQGRGRGGDASLLEDPELLLVVHLALGLTLVLLAVLRIVWRRSTPLPPWADGLSPGERRLESMLERVLLALLLVVPATGLVLVLGDDDLLPLHVAAHVSLYVALALHVGLVLRHTVVRRERHLHRML